jgi:hypothetical protein
MQLTSVGEIIARRDLYILNDDEPDEEVVVLIGKPWPFSDLKDYYCPHQITGGGEEGVRYAGEVGCSSGSAASHGYDRGCPALDEREDESQTPMVKR